ncbi:MAG: tyrosine-type recombinase/integrase [Chloroflexota bacterium]|nr:tyrosine-type recombinase/integrase [Chloroflexota bacterium]
MANRDLFECLLEYGCSYFRLRNYAETTRRGYLGDQLLFVRFLKSEYGVSRVGEVERRHVVDYLTQVERRGVRSATVARKLAALRSFFGYLEEEGSAGSSPVRGLRRPKQESAQPRVLSYVEYARLREAAAGDPRGRAIIEVFLQTGIRLSEAARLRVEDVALPDGHELPGIGSLRVWGKGRKERTITLNSRACAALIAYLSTRAEYEGNAPLFVSKYGAALTGRSIERIVAKLTSSTGIAGASVHTLRHTFATHSVRKGTNVRVVQEALGHSSLQTTSRYVSLARELMDEQLEANAL